MNKNIIIIGLLALLSLLTIGCSSNASPGEQPEKIKLDYAHYSPTSLIIKEFGWLEEEFEEDGIEIEWVQSQGGNKAFEFLASSSIDFGSSAGTPGLISKSNGAPVKSIYAFSKPEWTALVTNSDSGIDEVKDLKGKKVAATLGTEPYIFLLRALDAEGVSVDDVEIVNLPPSDGASALISGSVDAWAGIDPQMARLEVESDAKVIYREADFNTYGLIYVREQFAEEYPEYVNRVISVYEKARQFALENPDETAEILAEAADIPVEVAHKQLERTEFLDPIPGKVHHDVLVETGQVLQDTGFIKDNIDIEELVTDLIDSTIAKDALEKSE